MQNPADYQSIIFREPSRTCRIHCASPDSLSDADDKKWKENSATRFPGTSPLPHEAVTRRHHIAYMGLRFRCVPGRTFFAFDFAVRVIERCKRRLFGLPGSGHPAGSLLSDDDGRALQCWRCRPAATSLISEAWDTSTPSQCRHSLVLNWGFVGSDKYVPVMSRARLRLEQGRRVSAEARNKSEPVDQQLLLKRYDSIRFLGLNTG